MNQNKKGYSMDNRIMEYLDDCISSDSELKNKVMALRKRGYSLDISDNHTIMLNGFAWELDSKSFVDAFNQPIDVMVEKLFSMDGTNNTEVCSRDRSKWGDLFGSNTMYGSKVGMTNLEPFVARLVRAVALCGIFTNFSCDGWHLNKQKNSRFTVIFTERYSMLWFLMLLESDDELKGVSLNYKTKGCEFYATLNEENRFDVYTKMDMIAEIIYRKREYFHKCKDLVKNLYKGLPKSTLRDDELLTMFRVGYERIKKQAYKDVGFSTKDQEMMLWKSVNDDSILKFITRVAHLGTLSIEGIDGLL